MATKHLLRTGFKNVLGYCVLLIFLQGVTTIAVAEDPTGKSVYKDYCASCHEGGFKGWITGAPDVDAPSEWELFRKKGLEAMVENTMKGTEHMDPKGGCGSCTREQIEAAVKHIDSKLKKEEGQ